MMTAHQGNGAGKNGGARVYPNQGRRPKPWKRPGRVSRTAFLNTCDAARPLYCAPVFHCVQVAR
jgi:hypothetical protein